MTRTAFRLAFPTVVLAVSSLGVFAPSALANDEASGRWLMRSRVISQSGHYEVTRGFRADRRGGNGIVIAASDVTIDLGGYAIEGSATPGAGIRVMPGVSNVTITNGSLTGFRVGVDVTGATNVRIEGLQIKGGDMGGPPPGEIGVLIVNSRGVVVERNVVTGTFLGILLAYGVVEPLGGLVEQKMEDAAKELQCIKSTLLASMQGYNPATAIEFGRKVLFSGDGPSFTELESHVKGKK